MHFAKAFSVGVVYFNLLVGISELGKEKPFSAIVSFLLAAMVVVVMPTSPSQKA